MNLFHTRYGEGPDPINSMSMYGSLLRRVSQVNVSFLLSSGTSISVFGLLWTQSKIRVDTRPERGRKVRIKDEKRSCPGEVETKTRRRVRRVPTGHGSEDEYNRDNLSKESSRTTI